MEPNKPSPKLLLLGRCGSGKTSMRSIIFLPIDYSSPQYPLPSTMFMDLYSVQIWDHGGSAFFPWEIERIYKDVEVLVFVFDIEEFPNDVRRGSNTLNDFQKSLKRLSECRCNPRIFVFLHKIDKFNDEQRQKVCEEAKKTIMHRSDLEKVNVEAIYETTIWDESLYRCWSDLLQRLTKNIGVADQSLKSIYEACEYDEAALFDKGTFLLLAKYSKLTINDEERFEKIANIIKLFRFTCSKKKNLEAEYFELIKDDNTIIIREFSPTLWILVVCSGTNIQPASIELSIKKAAAKFDKRYNEISNDILEAKKIGF